MIWITVITAIVAVKAIIAIKQITAIMAITAIMGITATVTVQQLQQIRPIISNKTIHTYVAANMTIKDIMDIQSLQQITIKEG